MRNYLKSNNLQSGFSLIESVVAIFVLTIGLIGTAAAISYALHYGTISRNVTTAKGMIVSSIEEIETLRNSRRLDFKQIANTGNVDNNGSLIAFAGFGTGYLDVSLNPGPDGVFGTDDDLLDAGPDTIYGTVDDFINPALSRSGYRREISITDLSASLKKVEVKIRYMGSGGRIGELNGVSYLNDEVRAPQ